MVADVLLLLLNGPENVASRSQIIYLLIALRFRYLPLILVQETPLTMYSWAALVNRRSLSQWEHVVNTFIYEAKLQNLILDIAHPLERGAITPAELFIVVISPPFILLKPMIAMFLAYTNYFVKFETQNYIPARLESAIVKFQKIILPVCSASRPAYPFLQVRQLQNVDVIDGFSDQGSYNRPLRIGSHGLSRE